MISTTLVLVSEILLAGFATLSQPNNTRAAIVPAQPPFQFSDMSRSDPAFIESQRSLEKQYGSALSQTAEELLAGLELPSGSKCYFTVTFLPGGEILRTDLSACQFDTDLQERIRTGLVGRTMPYAGFESIFQRNYRFQVCAPKSICAP